MRTRLKRFPAPIVEQVLDELKQQSLVDDAAFSKLWSESRDSLRPRSAWAVKRELVAKGIDEGLADEAVQDIDDEKSAYRAGLKHAQRLEGADPSTFQRRLWGYLKRRGFSDSVCRHTIERLRHDTELDGSNRREGEN